MSVSHSTRNSSRDQRGEKNPSATINDETAEAIFIDYVSGCRVLEIASARNVSVYTVRNIVNGRSWKHLRLHERFPNALNPMPDVRGNVTPYVSYREILEFPGYVVNDLGEVFSYRVGGSGWKTTNCKTLLKPFFRRRYLTVNLQLGKVQVHCLVHRLVLESFIGPCGEGKEAAHNNGIPTDNRLCNLRWATHRENMADKIEHGTLNQGESHSLSKLTECDVRSIFELWINDVSMKKIARRYDMNQRTIWSILNGRSWKHLRMVERYDVRERKRRN